MNEVGICLGYQVSHEVLTVEVLLVLHRLFVPHAGVFRKYAPTDQAFKFVGFASSFLSCDLFYLIYNII